MAQCTTCGEKAGMMREECRSCEQSRLSEAHASAYSAQYKRWEEQRQSFIDTAWESIHRAIEGGRSPQLYREVEVSVKSLVDDEWLGSTDFLTYQKLGHDGWETVGSVPRTMGVSLTNKQTGGYGHGNHTYGGGIGGNVIGATMIVRFTVTRNFVENHGEQLVAILAQQFDDANPFVMQ
jgi:hypothetical protein